jgi:hypothetical protein
MLQCCRSSCDMLLPGGSENRANAGSCSSESCQLMREVKARCMRAPIGCGGEVRDGLPAIPIIAACTLGWWHLPLKLRTGCHERADTARSWRSHLQPAKAPSQHRNPSSLSPHDASRFLQRHLAGHLHHLPQHATGSFPLAASLSALPEPHSISLRLHHCTSPTTHPHSRAW